MNFRRVIGRSLVGLFVLSLIGCTELKRGVADDGGALDLDASMSGDAGMSGQDGGSGQPPEPTRPLSSRFSTVGQPRGGGGFTLRDDGFEPGPRQCTASGMFCVTGGFEP